MCGTNPLLIGKTGSPGFLPYCKTIRDGVYKTVSPFSTCFDVIFLVAQSVEVTQLSGLSKNRFMSSYNLVHP